MGDPGRQARSHHKTPLKTTFFCFLFKHVLQKFGQGCQLCVCLFSHLSHDMRSPTMWYVHTRSLIRAFAIRLNILRV